MSDSVSSVDETARNSHSIVLQRIREPGRQLAVATAMGLSESTISRLKNEHLQPLCTLLAHCGLKIVPTENTCIAPDKINALLTLAKAHLDQIDSANQL
jgi:hypothetical protein